MHKLPTEISGVIYDARNQRFLADVRLHEPDGAVDYRLTLPGPITLGFREAARELATLARARHRHSLRHRSVPCGTALVPSVPAA